MLAWLNNATVRDGGITQRSGWQPKGRMRNGDAIFQGGFMYEPRGADPYPIVAIGGHIYRVDPNTGGLTDLSLTAFVADATPTGVYLKNLSAPPGVPLTIENDTPAHTDIGLSGTITGTAVGASQFVPLTSPYLGPVPIVVNIEMEFQITSVGLVGGLGTPSNPFTANNVVLKNINVPVGTLISVQPRDSLGNGWSIPSFTAPAIGASITLTLHSSQFGSTKPPPPPLIMLHFDIYSYLLTTSLHPIPGDAGTHPPGLDYFYFCQAEEFLVIQAGDFKTLPLFWDGTILRRSRGITDSAVAAGTPGINEIPPAGAMDYYMGRLWYAQGRQYSAGDIVGGPSGTGQYNFRDAVLNVTENPLVVGGDGFAVPDNAGNIRAIKHNANLDTTLGQGRLFIFTAKAIYALQVPVTRLDWIGANTNNQPLQTVVQLANGSVNDRSVVAVSGDLFFQSLEPGIRSLISAIRYFNQWGNIQISANENRVLQFNDRGLMRFSSGILFSNRMLQTQLPRQTAQGVVSSAMIPLDFVPISSFGEEAPPNWEGVYQGLDVFQLLVGNFGGLERAFAIVRSTLDGSFNLWELTVSDQRENGDNRIDWFIEFPAFTWGDEFALKKMTEFELWVDRLMGEVAFKMEWRPDGDPCWKEWITWKQCSARNSCEDVNNPICYPLKPFAESFRATMTGPVPPSQCESITGRPANVGYQMQVKLTITGFCRIRGLMLYAEPVIRKPYANLVC